MNTKVQKPKSGVENTDNAVLRDLDIAIINCELAFKMLCDKKEYEEADVRMEWAESLGGLRKGIKNHLDKEENHVNFKDE